MADNAGLVVAPQSESAYAGADVLNTGGNAADALVTAALVQGVADPHRCGIGGFGCATVYWAESDEALAINFLGQAGSGCREDQWVDILENPAPDGFGFIVQGKVNDVGYQSITTPGMLAGLASIHERFGALPWRDVVNRAAKVAETGFLVGPGLAEFWIRPGLYGRVSTQERLGFTEYGRQLWLDAHGSPFRSGHHVKIADLAQTYRTIAEEGPQSFYRGTISQTIAADWTKGGAFVTAQDLEDYSVECEAPLEGSYRGHRVLTSSLPAGGTALLQTLALLESSNADKLPLNSPDYIETIGEILRVVWSDRLAHHGDPRFQSISSADLLAPSYLDSIQRAGGGKSPAPPESPDTTQLSIVDGRGNCVSFSHSLGYGSGVLAPGLGFMFNNCMSGFDPRVGEPNSILPGKARSTAIAETIVFRGDRPFLVLGSPGAARITAAIVQAITNVLDRGMTISEAVIQPRFDAHGDRSVLLDARFPLETAEILGRRGWNVTQSPKPFGVVGRVYAIEICADGSLVGGVDPGEPGAAVRSEGS